MDSFLLLAFLFLIAGVVAVPDREQALAAVATALDVNLRQSRALDEAIVESGKLRLRPIFLTSITTIAGLFPLSLATESLPHLAPMAQVIVYGLTFSTLLTLLVVPCLYRLDVDLAARAARWFAPFKHWATDPGAATEDTADTTAE